MQELERRLREVQQRIEQACQRVGRDPAGVNVVAVTKYIDIEKTKHVLDAGCLHIGESRVQDAVPKWKELHNRGTWHMIGHLQRNKAKEVVGRFSYLHSLENIELAKEIDRRAQPIQAKMKCFIQVNISGEETKFGISRKELEDFTIEMANFSSIEVVGLMTMAPHIENREEIRSVFRELKECQHRLQKKQIPHVPMTELSMGMSQDFEIAIEEGATWIRLGSILVGE
ncbi:YggS family pyridoxal phosphate-dependent enzyme [Thermoactinomyces sp. DSM 45892]|uniref:YggS family pyridoxal phosphate-dependent enzyme n=1 Tax=Thermoactinomyces sp. DSM 45892 TaxID=1882753 RepID=UPI00089612A1|nr:YggS family pyridoxal phosphate-dependent enzyme [Thermoactinomyces sp. DSM 45892]SDY59897.1 hypothetical protein SAMN05444416_10684 [Thermoactinomyces sp. DSM 45892]